MTLLSDCFKDIKTWMTQNFLKLNDDKTEIMILKSQHSPKEPPTVFCLDNSNITSKGDAKNLGFLFNSNLTLDMHINNVTRTCYMNLRNLGRIGSKLTQSIKIQLVHSCVHSFLDNYNAVFGSLSESNLKKLQKVQNAAVRFIFSLYGKNKYQSITPYLQQLHFLPVRYRIKYKICVTVYKCINNLAPTYLSSMISLRTPNVHQLRLDNDFFLLSTPPTPNLSKTEAAFSYSSPRIWNELSYKLRSMSTIEAFKKSLKTYYFTQAFQSTLTNDELLFM